MSVTPTTIITKFNKSLLQRDLLINLFTECDRYIWTDDVPIDVLYLGKIVEKDGILQCVMNYNETDDGLVVSLDEIEYTSLPLLSFQTELFVSNKEIINGPKTPIQSTVGRYILNYMLLVDPFQDSLPYINDIFNDSKIESDIVKAAFADLVTTDQINTYTNNLYFIGHFTELSVPSMSEKSLSTDPNIKDRRDELLEKHKDELDDPIVLSKIEDELIAMDKAYIEGDSSAGFYMSSGKAFDVCRKRMLVTGGMFGEFGDSSEYNFVNKSLDEGWEVDDVPVLFNDIRKGSYDRAVSTAKGGEESKFLTRIFQDTKIIEHNCKTTKGLKVYMSSDVIDKYNYRYIITSDGIIALTPDIIQSYLNKVVVVRSPQYCKSIGGLCAICMGQVYEKLDKELLNLEAMGIGSEFLTSSLKSMHGIKSEVVDISELDNFIL